MTRRACHLLLVLGLGSVVWTGCPATTAGTRRTAPKGPRIHFAAGEDRSPARLVLEVDPRKRPVGPATLHTFHFTLEEKITPDGDSAQVNVRFNEVVGQSGEPQLSDQLALAMDDLKISFRRSARGEVSELKVDGLRAPLDEPTAHAIAFALFSTDRGPRLPDKKVGVQDDWTIESESELMGLTTHHRHFYTLTGENDASIEVREKGHVEGIATISGSRRKIEGDSYSLETIDTDRGTVLSGEYEWNVLIDDEPSAEREIPGVGRTKIRAERGKAAEKKKRR